MKIKEHFEEHGRIHTFWTIGVLVVLVIFLVSSDLGKAEGVKDILAFAVSFASLLLALIAIAQSALSGGSTAETLGAVNATSKQVEQSASRLFDLTQSIPDAIAGIERTIAKPAEDLLAAALQINSYSSRLSTTAEDIRETQLKIIAASEKKSTQNPEVPLGQKALFPSISINDLIAVYIVRKSFESAKAFRINDIFNRYDGHFQYINGIISGLAFVGLVKYSEKEDFITIEALNFDDEHKKQLDLATNRKLQDPLFMEDKDAVDDYFRSGGGSGAATPQPSQGSD